MSNPETETNNAVAAVYLMSEEDLQEASKSKEFADGVIVVGEVKSATRVTDESGAPIPTVAGALKGTPQVNLMINVFADPNDTKTKIDNPVVWHKQSLALALKPGEKLSDQALGIANAALHALSGGTVPRVTRNAKQTEKAAGFNETQKYSLAVWQEPKKLVGARVIMTLERTPGKEPDTFFTNARTLRRELFDNEKFTSADDLFIK